MNPTIISLKNFTSYKDETVNLEGIDIAVATGENGAGKSSLVTDAITWCLFGEGSKGGKKNLNDYVKRGEQECRVEIQFHLGREIYRVVRHRSSAKDKTLLEYFVQDRNAITGEVNWVARSGKTIAETQEIIESTLRMDYRTFISSSLVLQGKADSFTSDMTDAERKEALARILGLDIWDQLQEKVKKQLKDLNEKLATILTKKAPLEAKATAGVEAKQQLADAQEELKSAETDLQQLKDKQADFIKKTATESTLKSSVDDNKRKLDQKQEALRKAFNDIEAVGKKITRANTILANKTKVEEAVDEEKTLTTEINSLKVDIGKKDLIAGQVDDALKAKNNAQTELDKLTASINSTNTELAKVNDILESKEEILEACEQEKYLSDELQEDEKKAASYKQYDVQIKGKLEQLNKWDSDYRAAVTRLETEISSKQPMVDTLSTVPCGEDLKSSCKLLANARAAAVDIASLKTQLQEEQAKTNPYAAEFNDLVQKQKDIGYNETQHQACKNLLSDIRLTSALKPQLDAAETRKAELETKLKDDQAKKDSIDLQELQQKYITLNAQLDSIKSKEILLTVKNTRFEQVKGISSLKPELDSAAALLPELQNQKEKAEEDKRSMEAEIDSINNAISAANESLKDIDLFKLQSDDLNRQIGQAESHGSDLKKDIGRYEQIIADAQKDEKQLQEILLQEKDIRKDISLYDMLDQACGKKSGVPALIIENAVPEIERLANDVLNRVTGGRMQLRLDTQVEGKSTGAMQDVLRITILDEGLPGPYQTYSGAEKFIIDISLRVAISKFLAHRAGAEIKLLVIDEGFGSLDASGRQKILSVIDAIRQDFAKVIIITHLEELKDAFPRRIEVTKGPEGSKVNVA